MTPSELNKNDIANALRKCLEADEKQPEEVILVLDKKIIDHYGMDELKKMYPGRVIIQRATIPNWKGRRIDFNRKNHIDG